MSKGAELHAVICASNTEDKATVCLAPSGRVSAALACVCVYTCVWGCPAKDATELCLFVCCGRQGKHVTKELERHTHTGSM